MDKIIIENLELFANHGVFPEETKLGIWNFIYQPEKQDIRMI